jgi:hypothetical protein
MNPTVRTLSCLLALNALLTDARAEPLSREVRDTAGLFDPAVVAKANRQIEDIRNLYHVDVLIETIKEIPPKTREHLEKERNPARAFAVWAETMARNADVNGVYMLISTDPNYRHAFVTAWPESQREVFTPRKCDHLRRLFVEKNKHSQQNQALLDVVAEIREVLDNALQPSSFSWVTVGVVIGVVLTFWLLLGLIRMRLATKSHAKAAPSTSEGPPPRQVPGLLGGMFGSVAGMWIYDKVFHPDRGPRPDQPPKPAAPEQPEVPAGQPADVQAPAPVREELP